jgi:hypothetical protein
MKPTPQHSPESKSNFNEPKTVRPDLAEVTTTNMVTEITPAACLSPARRAARRGPVRQG